MNDDPQGVEVPASYAPQGITKEQHRMTWCKCGHRRLTHDLAVDDGATVEKCSQCPCQDFEELR